MNGRTVYKHKSISQNTHLKQQRSCIGTYFGSSLHEEEFVSKTINEGSVNLDKFPASKVHQLAKKYESSKATARQVAGEMQAIQIHLMTHQCTELSNGKYKKQKPQAKQRPTQNKNGEISNQAMTRSPLIPEMPKSKRTDAAGVEIPPT